MLHPLNKVIRLSALTALMFGSASALAGTLQSITTTEMPNNGVKVFYKMSEAPDKPSSFETTSPFSIVLDMPNTDNGLTETNMDVQTGFVDTITTIEGKNRTRSIVKLVENSGYTIDTNADGITLTVNGTPATQTAAKVPMAVMNSITNIDFRRNASGSGVLELDMSDDQFAASVRKRVGGMTINISGAQFDEGLLKEFDVVDFATPVSVVTSANTAKGAQLTISGTAFESVAYQSGKKYIVEFKPAMAVEEAVAEKKESFEGERLTLNFQDIEVRRVLQMIAEFTGNNLVVSDSVTGNITLNLKDVPWDQALDIVLKTKGLALRHNDTLMFIDTADSLAEREKKELQAELDKQLLAPIESEMISVNYAKAATLADMLKNKENKLLTDRGHVTVDVRTNTLLIQDTQAKIDQVRALVQKLDIPVRQVLVEARVVIATNEFAKDLGVRLGVSGKATEGNNVLNFGGAGVVAPDSTVSTANDNLLVSLPASNLTGAGVANVVLGQLGSHLLRLELSAMQQEGRGEVVSSPRLLTSNQQEASIEQGLEVPYTSSAENGGTTVEFKEAKLKFVVTPQITPDDNIMMDLVITKDTLGSAIAGMSERPIDSRELKTKVLVKNGQTVVLGGVYEREESKSEGRIPFFGDLPYVGFMFKNKYVVNETNELLIFITPKLLSDTTLAAAN